MPAHPKFLFIRIYMAIIAHRPAWVLLTMAVFTGMLAWHLPMLSFKTAIYDLIIEELPQAREYRDFRNIFGSDEMVRIVVRADDVFDPITFTKILQLSDAALGIDGVRRVLSLAEVKKNVDPRSEWPMDKFRAMLEPVDLFRRNLISEDRKTTIITLVLGRDANKEAVVSATRQLIENGSDHLTLYQIGMPLVSEALAHYARSDFLELTPLTMLIIALLLFVLFRNSHCILLPLACVSLSTIWTFGYMAFRGVAVSMLTIIVPVFIIAVGTAYCMHICSAYLTCAQRVSDPKQAVKETFSTMAFPVTLAVLTTLFGIGSLAISRITAIKAFAEFACFGIASLWMAVLFFFPALLAVLPLPRRQQTSGAPIIDRCFDWAMARLIQINLHHQKTSLTIIGLIAAICFGGLFWVRVETNPVSYFKTDTAESRHFHDIYQEMSGAFPMHVVMRGNVDDYFEDPSHVAELDRLQTFLASLEGVDKAVSFADYLKLVNYASNRFDPEYYRLPEERYDMRMLINTFKSLLGNDLLLGFMSADMRQANILMLTHISSSQQFIKTREEILQHAMVDLDQSISLDVTGLGIVMAASSQLLTIGQVKSLSLSLVLIFMVMVLLFLSGKVGLIAIVPNLFPILVNFGLMGLFGIPLSVATSLIASVAIGLAVDDTIHYLVRYNAEFKKDLDKDRAMCTTLTVVGRPIMFTSLTIGTGFAVLLFSHFQPTATFGLLMVVTMASALVGDLILLPTFMMHVELITAWDLLKMMPTTGGMSAGMAHELNQPLNAIKVGNDVIRMMAKKGKQLEPAQIIYVTEEIGKQVNRASQMIERFQDIGELSGFQKSTVGINKPISETLKVLSHQLQLDNIIVETHLSENLPAVKAHYNRLVQVAFNILSNAREAIKARRRFAPEEDGRIVVSTFVQKGAVVLSIQDNGCGFSQHHIDRAYEPFFTTKATGQGKGLGLTICRQIVRDCRGSITLANREPTGAEVTIRLPPVYED